MKSTKILHCGDIHLGARFGATPEIAESRREEHFNTFKKIAETAKSQFDVLLIAGDFFDKPDVDNETVQRAAEILKNAAVPVFIAPGNHDPASPDSVYLNFDFPDNVHIFTQNTLSYKELPDLNLRVWGAGFIAPVQREDMIGTPSLSKNMKNILVVHGDLNAEAGGPYHSVDLNRLKNIGFDYCALGHVHTSSVNGNIAYSGCCEGTGFDEYGSKGALEVTVGDEGAVAKFSEMCFRKYMYADFDGRELTISSIESQLGNDYKGNIYRINLTDYKNPIEVNEFLKKNLYYVSITDGKYVLPDYESLSKENNLRGEFVRRMIKIIESDPDNIKINTKALNYGITAFDREGKDIMIITELYIRGFGKLTDFSLFPSKNLNLIYGDNESGKTTLMTFIRACFYGVGGKNSLREKYRPHSGAPMSGYIVFEHNGTLYKLDRTFGATASKDTAELWNTATGQQEPIPAKVSVGEYLFEITEATFLNTVYIGQSAFAIGSKNDEIIKKLNNLITSNDEDISYKEVSDRIIAASKKLKSRSQDSLINKLTAEDLKLCGEKLELNGKCALLSEQISEYKKGKFKLEEVSEKIKDAEKQRTASLLKEKYEKLNYINDTHTRLKSAEIELKSAEKNILFKGSFLTHEDVRKLSGILNNIENLEGDISQLQENLSSIENRKKDIEGFLKTQPEISENLDDIRKLDNLYNDKISENKFNNTKKAIGFNPAAVIIFLIFIIIGILFYAKLGIISIIVGGILAVAALIIGCCIKVKPKVKYKQELERQNRKFLNDCKCDTVDELLNKFEQVQKNNMQLEAVTIQYAKVVKMVSSKKQELAKSDNEADEFFKSLPSVYSELEQGDILNAVDSNISSYKEAKHRLEYCQNEFGRAVEEKNIEQIKDELSQTEILLNELKCIPEKTSEYYGDVLSSLNEQKNKITEEIALLSVKEEELSETRKRLEHIESLISENKERLQGANEDFSALELAAATLDSAFEEMQKSFSPIVNKKAGEFLSVLTGERYSEIYISKTLAPTVNAPEDNRLYDATAFSDGTIDQIYLALRLAISDAVLNNLKLPIMLDDGFARFDDRRMKNAAELICQNRLQAFLFTCRKSDAEAADKLGAKMIILNDNRGE